MGFNSAFKGLKLYKRYPQRVTLDNNTDWYWKPRTSIQRGVNIQHIKSVRLKIWGNSLI